MAQQKPDKLPSNDTIEILEQILERQHITVGKVSCKRTSEFTVNSTKDFINKIKTKQIPGTYKLMSFDITSLF